MERFVGAIFAVDHQPKQSIWRKQMGLDMYLYANKYLWSYPKDGKDAQISKDIAALCEVPNMEVKEVMIQAAYWRKANQVHDWFVKNVQNGVDDCGHYEVSREQLADLLAVANKVNADKKLAPQLLPTAKGFFFGNTEYGEWYDQDIEETIDQITKALALPESWEFKYHSSW